MNSTAVIVGAWPPPAGVIPNFSNPESIGYRIVIAAVLCPIIAIIFTLLRLYTNHFLTKCLHIDDYSITLALVCAVTYSILQICQTKNGSGVHIWDVPLDKFEKYILLGIGGGVTYGLATLFTKASILLFYIRLSLDTPFRVAAYVVLFISTGYCLAGAFAFLYYCQPIPKYWNFYIPGKCVNIGRAFLAGAAINVATDLTILLLPIWLLWPLHLPTRRKVGVTAILMAGSFVCAVSIIRLAEIPSGLKDPDSTWRYVPNLIWCIIEMYTGIICSCLPSLKAFTKHHFPNMFRDGDRPEPVLHGLTGLYTDLNQQLENGATTDLWHGNNISLKEQPSGSTINTGHFGKKHLVASIEPVQRPQDAFVR